MTTVEAPRVCVGLLTRPMTFQPLCYHNHPPSEPHTDEACQIRTYQSPLTVDARWRDATLVRNASELVQQFTLGLPVDGRLVMVPIEVVEEYYGFKPERFAEPES